MSVQELFDFQQYLLSWLKNPSAWLLQANPVWGSTETVNRIAIFDTKEKAEEYVRASELNPEISTEDRRTPEGFVRTYRPDSLLWDYNPAAFMEPMIVP